MQPPRTMRTAFSVATPYNSRLPAQAAYRAKIFRGIFPKCSPSHQGLSVLLGSFRKKFSRALHHLELHRAATIKIHFKWRGAKEQFMFGMIPFGREENSLFNYLDNMERSLFTGFGDMSQFRCDIQDKGDAYLMEAELPGFNKEDIAIDLNGDNLMITARHNSESGEKDEKGNYVRRERKFGSFSRSFDVSGIDTTAIKAAYNNGILELTLPKKGEVAPASRSIQIEG